MNKVRPVNKIRINNQMLVEYETINHNLKNYYLHDGTILDNINQMFAVEILDEVTKEWRSFNVKRRRWKDYIFQEYISRSRAMKGKNTWTAGRTPSNVGMTLEEFHGKDKAAIIRKTLSKAARLAQANLSEASKKSKSRKLSAAFKGRKQTWHRSGMKGMKHTTKAKLQMSKKIKQRYIDDPTLKFRVSHSGADNGMYGKTHDIWTRMAISEKVKLKYATDAQYREQIRQNGVNSQLSQNRKVPQTEKRVEEVLLINNVEYIHQHIMTFYSFDFFIPKLNAVIEVQGDYWHANPKLYEESSLLDHQREKRIRDRQKKTYVENRGYTMYEIWESDIKKNDFSKLQEIFDAFKI